MDLQMFSEIMSTAPVPLTMLIAVWVYKLDRRQLRVETLLESILRKLDKI